MLFDQIKQILTTHKDLEGILTIFLTFLVHHHLNPISQIIVKSSEKH